MVVVLDLLNIAVSILQLILFVCFIIGVDQCIQKFLDVARQTECFFLQKRLQLSVQKPEQVVKEVHCYIDICLFIYTFFFKGFSPFVSRIFFCLTTGCVRVT